MLFGKKKEKPKYDANYDTTGKMAVLRCSICNGEQVAGFKDPVTGSFDEIALIRSEAELNEFLRFYGVDEIHKEY